jgi:2'-5' RNA ligase
VPAADVGEYVEGLRETLRDFKPFEIRTAGLVSSTYVEAGEEKHFVGYAVEKSEELLALHNRLLAYTPWIKREQPPFEPHLSIAYGDLSAEGRTAIMHLVEKNPGIAPAELSWTCDNVGLYHRVGGEWKPFAVITAGCRVAR